MEERPRLPRPVAIALVSVSVFMVVYVIVLLILSLRGGFAIPAVVSEEHREGYATLASATQRVAELAPSYQQADAELWDTEGTAVLTTGTSPATTASTTSLVAATAVRTAGPSPTDALAPAATVTTGPTATYPPTGTNPPTVTPAMPASATPTLPQPSDTAAPSTSAPKRSRTPTPAFTSKPTLTATPEPTAVEWTWSERLVSVGEDGQYCGEGYLRIRVMALDPYDNQIPGVWIYDRYSKIYQVTGNVDAPDWGPGETMFNYGGDGGGALCITQGMGGDCLTGYTRDMPCFNPPPFEDMWAAGWCQCCGTEAAADKELCQEMHERGDRCMNWGHYAWRVIYRRSW